MLGLALLFLILRLDLRLRRADARAQIAERLLGLVHRVGRRLLQAALERAQHAAELADDAGHGLADRLLHLADQLPAGGNRLLPHLAELLGHGAGRLMGRRRRLCRRRMHAGGRSAAHRPQCCRRALACLAQTVQPAGYNLEAGLRCRLQTVLQPRRHLSNDARGLRRRDRLTRHLLRQIAGAFFSRRQRLCILLLQRGGKLLTRLGQRGTLLRHRLLDARLRRAL